MFKKLTAVITALIMLFCAISSFSLSASAKVENGSLVVLGDSIAEGFGIYNSDEACYGKIVADSLGYSYKNYGKNGDRTIDLLNKLSDEKISADVTGADLILISIGGNDFLQQNLPVLFFSVMRKDYHHINNIKNELVKNFALIIEKVKALNHDALIVCQTVYNARTDLFRDFYGIAVDAINDTICGYLEEHPGAYELVDVKSAIGKDKENIAIDTVHPSAVGNETIATAIMYKLYQTGYTDSFETVILKRGIDRIPFLSYIMRFIHGFFVKV
ncbi:MAG: hypothetical protein K6F09_02935 [Clostridiales bacterium]|nr:hypothetical protein [Clostridiales bacterium]